MSYYDRFPIFIRGHCHLRARRYDAGPRRHTVELAVTSMHPGITREQVATNTGRSVRFADALGTTPALTKEELLTMPELHPRAERARRDSQEGGPA